MIALALVLVAIAICAVAGSLHNVAIALGYQRRAKATPDPTPNAPGSEGVH